MWASCFIVLKLYSVFVNLWFKVVSSTQGMFASGFKGCQTAFTGGLAEFAQVLS